ncbi:extracellular solute-binding protein, partial [bacterium]|nr:extracellular solute-binding protein [bacterium]
MMFKRSLALFALVAVVFTSGCGGPTAAETAANAPVKLTIWRVFDDGSTMKDVMTAYTAIHKNVTFNYREVRLEDYQNELLHAFAEGTGPDVFSLHNDWIGGYESLILPMPASLTIPYTETRGTIKKETVITLKEEPTITTRQLKTDFVDAVAGDVIRAYQPNPKKEAEDRIFALPLSVDTLALYYNKDWFNFLANI